MAVKDPGWTRGERSRAYFNRVVNVARQRSGARFQRRRRAFAPSIRSIFVNHVFNSERERERDRRQRCIGASVASNSGIYSLASSFSKDVPSKTNVISRYGRIGRAFSSVARSLPFIRRRSDEGAGALSRRRGFSLLLGGSRA